MARFGSLPLQLKRHSLIDCHEKGSNSSQLCFKALSLQGGLAEQVQHSNKNQNQKHFPIWN